MGELSEAAWPDDATMDEKFKAKMCSRLNDEGKAGLIAAIGFTRSDIREIGGDQDVFDERLAQLLTGDAEKIADLARKAEPRLGLMRMSPFCRIALDHYGLKADVVSALSLVAGKELSIDFADGNRMSVYYNAHFTVDPELGMSFFFGTSSALESMDQDTLQIWQRVPETIKTMLVGRPLCDLVSHPLLERADYLITETEDEGDSLIVTIRMRSPTS